MQPPRHRLISPGFTLVELLVALVLFSCALLALAGSAAIVVRSADAAQRRALARIAAESRIAWLRSMPCPSAQVGTATPAAGVREWWEVVPLDSATRLLDDSVYLDLAGRRAAVALHSAVRC